METVGPNAGWNAVCRLAPVAALGKLVVGGLAAPKTGVLSVLATWGDLPPAGVPLLSEAAKTEYGGTPKL
jgi:hypothetical protein